MVNLNPNMANDAVFTGGGLASREENVFNEEFMSNAYYLPEDDPATKVKKFWRDILDINREKVDKLMTDTNGTMAKRNNHHKSGAFHNRQKRAENQKSTFHRIVTAGPYKLGIMQKVESSELIWNPASVTEIESLSLSSFLTTRNYKIR